MFAYRRLQDLWSAKWSVGDLVAFHRAHKCLLLAHCQEDYRQLGCLIDGAKQVPRKELRTTYEAQFMSALKQFASPAKHTPFTRS